MINNSAIAEIADRTPTAEAFFTYAACRERNVREGISRLSAIRVQMAKEGFTPVPQDLLSMFRELEKVGVGQLKGDLFKWSVSIKEVGETISAPREHMAEIPKIPKSIKTFAVYYDNGRHASISFTPNLTKEEIKFLAEQLLKECK